MKTSFVTVSIALGISLVGCPGNGGSDSYGVLPTPPSPGIAVPGAVGATARSHYSISVFAKAPGKLQPDDMVQMGSSVFVICQDTNVNPDGTLVSGVSSAQAEVIEYNTTGKVLQTFKVP